MTDEPVPLRSHKTPFPKYLFVSVLIHLSAAALLLAHLPNESKPMQTGRVIPVFLVPGVELQKDSGQPARVRRTERQSKVKEKGESPASLGGEEYRDRIQAAETEMSGPVQAADFTNFPPASPSPAHPAASLWTVKPVPVFFSSSLKKYFIYVQDQLPGLLQRSLPVQGLDELKGREREVRILFDREGRIQNLTLEDSGEEEILSRLLKEQVPWDALLAPLHFGLPNRAVLLRIGIRDEGKISVFADLL